LRNAPTARCAAFVCLIGVLLGLGVARGGPEAVALFVIVLVLYGGAMVFGRSEAPGSSTWWAHPAVLITLSAGPALLVTWLTPAGHFISAWSTPKYFTTSYAFISLGALGCIVAGAGFGDLLGRRMDLPASHDVTEHRGFVAKAANVFFLLAMFGYGVYVLAAFARGFTPATAAHILAGTPGVVAAAKQTSLNTIPGVTTFTQFGPLASTLIALSVYLSGWTRRLRFEIAALLFAALLWSLFYASRLQLVETAIPVVFVSLLIASQRTSSRVLRGLIGVSPLFLPAIVLLIFGLFEYSRSWQYYKQFLHESYATFALDRLAAYYATAVNNGVLFITHDPRLRAVPYFTIEWLWRFPIPGPSHLLDHLAGGDPLAAFTGLLQQQANPAFNNPGGLLAPVFDWGVTVGLAVWTFIAGGFGLVYRLMRRGSVFGWVAYPVLVTGMLEVGLVFYWSDGRAFPMLLGVGALWVVLWRKIRRQAALPAAGAVPVDGPPVARGAASHTRVRGRHALRS
jgi:hypothetical protein